MSNVKDLIKERLNQLSKHAISYYYWDSIISPEEEIELQYCFNTPIGKKSWYNECELFLTKEELLKSL